MDGTAIDDGRMRRGVIDEGLRRLKAVREAVGHSVDILVQIPSYDMCLEQMLELAAELRPYDPFWYQTAFPDPDDTARFARSTDIPVAGGPGGGFRLDRSQWRPILERGAASITNPDLMNAGGIWEMKKTAAAAEAWGVAFSPHSPYGPIHTAADVHLCATTASFSILEYSYGEAPWRGAITRPAERIVDGHAVVPDRPGLGLELDESQVARHPLGPHPAPGSLDPVWGAGPTTRARRQRS